MAEIQMLRTSERAAFKRCPWAWNKAYREGLVPKAEQAGALWFGTGIHLALAEWYIPGVKRGKDPVETWLEYCDEQFRTVKTISENEEEWVDAKELGIEMLTNYIKEYGNDDKWEVIGPEQRFSALIPRPGTSDPIRNFVGTFDGVYRQRDTGRLHLIDHKTAAQIKTNHLFNDEQAGGYVMVAEHALKQQGLIGPKERIWGITFNFLRKAKANDDRPKNPKGLFTNKPTKAHFIKQLSDEFGGVDEVSGLEWSKLSLAAMQEVAETEGIVVYGEVSKNQGTPLFHREDVRRTSAEKKRMIKRIGEEGVVMDAVDRGELPILKTPADHCAWCQFKDLCSIDEQNGDTEEFTKFSFNVVDPYHDHRDNAVNSKTSLTSKKSAGV